jgi:hypothetical protein
MNIVSCLLVLATTYSLHQLDVHDAFLIAIYMEKNLSLPFSFPWHWENLVCASTSSLEFKASSLSLVCQVLYNYPRCWFCTILTWLFVTHVSVREILYNFVDLCWWYSYYEWWLYFVSFFNQFLRSHFWIKDLGDLKYFLGIKISL